MNGKGIEVIGQKWEKLTKKQKTKNTTTVAGDGNSKMEGLP